jgi:hypothetical protein
MSEDMQVRNLAPNTRSSYLQQISLFARHFNKSPEKLGAEEIRAYQVYFDQRKEAGPKFHLHRRSRLAISIQGVAQEEMALR